jgi:hypothetical protein
MPNINIFSIEILSINDIKCESCGKSLLLIANCLAKIANVSICTPSIIAIPESNNVWISNVTAPMISGPGNNNIIPSNPIAMSVSPG